MLRLNAIIIDDELQGRNYLHYLLKSHCPEIDVIGKCGKPNEAKKMIYDLKPDVVFLDINMPRVNGFELLDSLVYKDFMLVFVTAHSEFGIQAVKANAVDYLLKPISFKDLLQTVKKLVELHSKDVSGNGKSNNNRDKIIISQLQGFTILDVCDVVRLTADDNYTTIFLKDKNKIIASKTLKHFEEILPNNNFIRIHRSEMINIHFLKEISYVDGGSVIMKDGTIITISKGKLPYLIEKVKEHSSSKI
jgi:two-component system LytT family response regulator